MDKRVSVGNEETNEQVGYRYCRHLINRDLLPYRQALGEMLDGNGHHRVLEVGSGSGLISSWALDFMTTGELLVIEDDPLAANESMQTIAKHINGRLGRVRRTRSLVDWRSRDQWDVIICDVVSTMCLDQPTLPLVRHFARYLSSDGVLVPHRLVHELRLSSVDFLSLAGVIRVDGWVEVSGGLCDAFAVSDWAGFGDELLDGSAPRDSVGTVVLKPNRGSRVSSIEMCTSVVPTASATDVIRCRPVLCPVTVAVDVGADDRVSVTCAWSKVNTVSGSRGVVTAHVELLP